MNETYIARREFLARGAAAAIMGRTALAAQPGPGAYSGTVCVLGATGRVGNLIVREALAAGFKVIAISRSADKLARTSAAYADSGRFETLQGDVSSELQAQDLAKRLTARFGDPHAVVAVLSSSQVDGPMNVLESPDGTLRKAFDANFFTHVIAARALIPTLHSSGVYVGINGGLANFPAAGMAQLTTTQSAIRSLYEVLALETQDTKRTPDRRPAVRALELFGLVDDGGGAAIAAPMRIEGAAVGQRVAQIIAQPRSFPGPILVLKAKAFS